MREIMVSFLTEEQHNKSDVQGKLFRGWKVGCNGGGVQQKIRGKGRSQPLWTDLGRGREQGETVHSPLLLVYRNLPKYPSDTVRRPIGVPGVCAG